MLMFKVLFFKVFFLFAAFVYHLQLHILHSSSERVQVSALLEVCYRPHVPSDFKQTLVSAAAVILAKLKVLMIFKKQIKKIQ